MRLRNALFAPGHSDRKMEKALASIADAVIFDLEDSVAPDAKDAARERVSAALKSGGGARIIVRINAPETPWYLRDIAAIVEASPAAICLPKCTGRSDLIRLVQQIDVMEAACGILPGMIGVLAIVTETAASLQNMNYAGATKRLRALCFGAEDLSADFGVTPRINGEFAAPLAAARTATIIAATAAGVPAIDTPFAETRDFDGLLAESKAAAQAGFAGKACIHPDQLATVAQAFLPSPKKLEFARSVVAYFAANPNAGVFSIDGKMVDLAHLKLAERVLTMAD